MVLQLVRVLPEGFVAEPRVHLGDFYEIDICAFEQFSDDESASTDDRTNRNGETATAIAVAPAPSLAVETEFPEQYAYEVLIFDLERERELVAAVEIVGPANKDRPANRQLFVAKCANLMQKGVCVSIVDLVTIRRFNLYAELLALLRRKDPAFADNPPAYAATCRKKVCGDKTNLETWSYRLEVGQPLPKLPIWLTEDSHILLDLEASYEETCRALRIA
jgi:hypothetical protein